MKTDLLERMIDYIIKVYFDEWYDGHVDTLKKRNYAEGYIDNLSNIELIRLIDDVEKMYEN